MPTQEQLLAAKGDLTHLAYRHDPRNNPTCYPDVALLLRLWVWLDDGLEAARDGAAYGPGNDGVEAHTISRQGFGRPVEDQFYWGLTAYPHLRDQLYRDLLRLRREWRPQLGQMVDKMDQRARDVADWPTRTQRTG